jgi:hypothetical protein
MKLERGVTTTRLSLGRGGLTNRDRVPACIAPRDRDPFNIILPHAATARTRRAFASRSIRSSQFVGPATFTPANRRNQYVPAGNGIGVPANNNTATARPIPESPPVIRAFLPASYPRPCRSAPDTEGAVRGRLRALVFPVASQEMAVRVVRRFPCGDP